MRKFSFSLFMLLFLWNISFATDSTDVPILPPTDTSGVDKITLLEQNNVYIPCGSTSSTYPFPLNTNLNMTCPPGYVLEGEADPSIILSGYVNIVQPVYDPNKKTLSITTQCLGQSTPINILVNVRLFCVLKNVNIP